MLDLIAWMNALLQQDKLYGVLFFALIALAESTAFIGIIVPATPILLLVGTLIGTGHFTPASILPGAMAGAILGYGGSFALGRSWGRRAIRHAWLRNHRRFFARAKLFLRRNGSATIILGRYAFGPLQSLVPLVAGSMGMNRRKFWLANVVSGVVWVLVTLTPGYLAGRGLLLMDVPLAWQHRFFAALALISVGLAIASVGLAMRKRSNPSF